MASGPEPSGLTQTVPTTLLQAVNQMLKAVGRGEVMSLRTENMTEDAQSALSMLSDTSVEVQSRGWHCNSEEDFALSPETGNGFVYLPNNTLAVKAGARSSDLDVTWRGQRLYDRGNHSFAFAKPVFVDIVTALQFEELPQPLRWYVLALSGRKFGVGRLPETSTFKFTAAVETDALSAALQYDQDSRDNTLPATSSHFASFRRGQRRII